MGLAENYLKVTRDVSEIAAKHGRDDSEIKVIAVSKTFPAEIAQQAIDSGISLLGENKIQEAAGKSQQLHGHYSLHMIGQVQSNKAKEAVALFDVIHSISKLKTATKLNTEAAKINKVQNILIQVNASGESSKSGIPPIDVVPLYESISQLQNINVLGLMTMAPFTKDTAAIHKTFKITREALQNLNSHFSVNLKELSMGMSNDYHIAISEGATMIRIGSAIFGQRNYNSR